MSGLEIKQKRQLHLFRWLFLLVLLIVLGIYIYFGIRWYKTGEAAPIPLPFATADASVDEERISREQVAKHKTEKLHPKFLIIDDYLIKSRVHGADLNENKMFTMPSNLDDVMWYDKSATPGGGVGAVILSGRNEGITRDGTFSKLEKLAERDIIEIERGDGRVIKYEVRDIQTKPLEWVNKIGMSEMMNSMDPSKEGLSLITDSGKWIPSHKEFDSRIIVRAVAK